jgi:TolB-like protein
MTDASESFAVGDWLVEPSINRISTATESIQLRAQLMEVLVYLASLEGRVATLESIHDDLWSGKVVSSGTIYNCIAELRQAFSTSGSNIDYIETLPKKGYRLAAPIVSRPRAIAESTDLCSIAILPLTNRSHDADIDYLCGGISEELLFGLSNVEGLKVYSASSLKDEELDARVIGLRFGAQLVLGGSLQAAGKRIRVILQLQNVADGEIIWSGRFDQSLDDLLDLQDAVADAVVKAVAPALPTKSPQSQLLKDSGTRNLDALNAFLLGKHILSRSTLQAFDEAIDYFERAVASDPSFARAHYRLYLANYMKRRQFGVGEGCLGKARIAAENARKTGYRPAVPWVHIQRRLYRDTRLGSRELALEAIENILDENSDWGSFAYEQLTWVLCDAGLFHAALDFAKLMLASPDHNFEDSDADEEVPHYTAACGRFDDAIRLWSGLIQKDPARPLFKNERSILYSLTGQFDYAAKDIDALDSPRFIALSRAFFHFYLGDRKATNEWHQALLDLPNVHPSYLLWSYCLVGDIDKGLTHYEKSVNEDGRSYIDFGVVRAMSRGKMPRSIVTELEDHPKFKDLLAKEGIDDDWQQEVIGRLNDITDITGVIVRAENTYSSGDD